MLLTADYHTHTPYSHGKNTILENAAVAKAKGLKEIAITDTVSTICCSGLNAKIFPLSVLKSTKRKSSLASECFSEWRAI